MGGPTRHGARGSPPSLQRQKGAAPLAASATTATAPVPGYSAGLYTVLFFYLICATALALLVPLTETKAGEIAYLTPVLVCLIELSKLCTSAVFDFCDLYDFRSENTTGRKKSGAVDGEDVSNTKKRLGFSSGWKYSIPSLTYAVMNNFVIYGVSFMEPATYVLLSNLNLVFAACFGYLARGQKFDRLQILGLLLLFLACIVVKLDVAICGGRAADTGVLRSLSLLPSGNSNSFASPPAAEIGTYDDIEIEGVSEAKELNYNYLSRPASSASASEQIFLGGRRIAATQHEGNGTQHANSAWRLQIGILLILVDALFSAVAGVFTEYLFQDADEDASLWNKNVWIYGWGALINAVFTFGLCVLAPPAWMVTLSSFSDLFQGFSPALWTYVFFATSMGLIISVVFRTLGNVVKCILKIAGTFCVTIFSVFVFKEPAHLGFAIGFVLFLFGVLLYSLPEKFAAPLVTPDSSGEAPDETLLPKTHEDQDEDPSARDDGDVELAEAIGSHSDAPSSPSPAAAPNNKRQKSGSNYVGVPARDVDV